MYKKKYTQRNFSLAPRTKKKCFIKLINDKKVEKIKAQSEREREQKKRRNNNKSAEGENWKLLKLTSAGVEEK